mmetsp:Transcript_10171/g.28541  ORF Transcript_10171/g.28541 Transcript_10171/m.28541 type:complete len:123 (+) Transcript_10171:180-548(+)
MGRRSHPGRSALVRRPLPRWAEPSGYRLTQYIPTHTTMQNENGDNVDLYVPRKCSWTNRLLTSGDHGSVQINVGNVDPVTGLFTGESTPFAISGYVRAKSEADMALTALAKANDAKAASGAE